MLALVLADRAVEIEAEIGAAIERVGGRGGIGTGRVELRDAGQGGEREFGRGEEQVAIAALEADLGLEPDARPGKPPLRPRAERPGDAGSHTWASSGRRSGERVDRPGAV